MFQFRGGPHLFKKMAKTRLLKNEKEREEKTQVRSDKLGFWNWLLEIDGKGQRWPLPVYKLITYTLNTNSKIIPLLVIFIQNRFG